jgi:hypothetical protein
VPKHRSAGIRIETSAVQLDGYKRRRVTASRIAGGCRNRFDQFLQAILQSSLTNYITFDACLIVFPIQQEVLNVRRLQSVQGSHPILRTAVGHHPRTDIVSGHVLCMLQCVFLFIIIIMYIIISFSFCYY